MLTFAEQIFLLSLDEATGHSFPLPEKALDFALAGALLMGLAAQGRIDAYASPVYIKLSDLTGDVLLDEVLTDITHHPGQSIAGYLRRAAGHAHIIRKAVILRLIKKGILKAEADTFLGVVADERYTIINHTEQQELRQRIREVVQQERVPEGQDVGLICLLDGCDLMHTLLSDEELKKARKRLALIDQLDPVGRAIIQAIQLEGHLLKEASHTLI